MTNENIKEAEQQERRSFIGFIISSVILISAIFCFAPIHTVLLVCGIAVITSLVVGFPFYYFVCWQSNKYYTKELKKLYGVEQ